MPVTPVAEATARNAARPNAKTRREATQPDQMPLDRTSLIGTLLTPNGRAAYLKLPRGALRRVETGDMVDGARITAIGEGMLMLTRGAETRALHIPGN